MKNVHVRPSPDPREKKACARTRQDRIYERIYYKDILYPIDKLFIDVVPGYPYRTGRDTGVARPWSRHSTEVSRGAARRINEIVRASSKHALCVDRGLRSRPRAVL